MSKVNFKLRTTYMVFVRIPLIYEKNQANNENS